MHKLWLTILAALTLGAGLTACDPKPQAPKAAASQIEMAGHARLAT